MTYGYSPVTPSVTAEMFGLPDPSLQICILKTLGLDCGCIGCSTFSEMALPLAAVDPASHAMVP